MYRQNWTGKMNIFHLFWVSEKDGWQQLIVIVFHHSVRSLPLFWTASSLSSQDTMKGHSSLQYSLSQWVAMFLFTETESAGLFLSPLTEATCYLLETRSSQLNFSVILLLPLRPLLLPPWKVKAAAKYVEVPVSLTMCLLFYSSPRLPQSASLFVFPSTFRMWKQRVENEAVWKCKEVTLCIQPQSCACCVFFFFSFVIVQLCTRVKHEDVFYWICSSRCKDHIAILINCTPVLGDVFGWSVWTWEAAFRHRAINEWRQRGRDQRLCRASGRRRFQELRCRNDEALMLGGIQGVNERGFSISAIRSFRDNLASHFPKWLTA